MKKNGDEEIEKAESILKKLVLKPGETFLKIIEDFNFTREEIKVKNQFCFLILMKTQLNNVLGACQDIKKGPSG